MNFLLVFQILLVVLCFSVSGLRFKPSLSTSNVKLKSGIIDFGDSSSAAPSKQPLSDCEATGSCRSTRAAFKDELKKQREESMKRAQGEREAEAREREAVAARQEEGGAKKYSPFGNNGSKRS
jgi:hypothetical protein